MIDDLTLLNENIKKLTKIMEIHQIRVTMVSAKIFMIALLTLMLAGGLLNLKVLATNDGKMPVLSPNVFSTDRHFSYQNPEQVNEAHLTDKYKIGRYYISRGVILILGPILPLVFVIIMIILYQRRINKLVREL